MNKHFIKKRDIFIFSFPALAFFTIFVIYPIFPQLLISFQKHDGFKGHGFVGLANYVSTIKSSSFMLATKNTYIIVLMSVLIAIPISMLLALLLDMQGEKVKRLFKITSVMPALISVTVIAQMWVAIYEPNWGLVNSILDKVGLDGWKHSWLTDSKTVLISVAIAYLWQYIGLNTLLFYTGIKTIPSSYKEASLIDGATFIKRSVFITIPLLQDVGKYVLIISTLGSMAQFAHVRIMTLGGPGDISRTTIYQMYYVAFSQGEFGVGSAIAILFVIQCIIISVLINRFIAREKIEY